MRNLAHNLFPFFGFLVFVGICHGAPELAPTLDAKLNGTNSVVYCPTLQIAWDGLAGIVGGPIQMQQQDDLAQELNSSSCPSNVVPEQAHVAMAGYAKQGFVADLKNALHEKFGEKAPELPSIFSDEQTEIITYSYLSRTLPFPKKFVRSKTRPLEFRCGTETHPVHCFGATRRNAHDFSSQVAILHHSGKNDFVVLLASQIENEFVVLAKIPQPETLSAGMETVRNYLEEERKKMTELAINGNKEYYSNRLSHGDFLAIPDVDLSAQANFPQLCNRQFTNPGFEAVRLRQVYQDVTFKMDETGATVRSTAYSAGDSFGGEPEPRSFIFDSPFLLTLWQKDAKLPYLAAWIASPDALIPFKTLTP